MVLYYGFKMYSWTLWTLILTIMIGSCVAGDCPGRCSCYRAVTCNGIIVNCWELTRVPTDYPMDTCYIDLSSNKITSIEYGTFSGLTRLQTLNLRSNEINNILNSTFSVLTSLQSLDLDGNSLTIIENDAFRGLTSLQTLDLRSNKITNIENGAFSVLTSLQTLYLQSNKITSIENGTLGGLTSLQTLDLSRNSITSIRKDAFDGLTRLRKLYVGRNPFHCDCSLEAFTEFLQKFLPYDSSSHQNPQCTTPNDRSGTELNKVSFEDCSTSTTRSTDSELDLESAIEVVKSAGVDVKDLDDAILTRRLSNFLLKSKSVNTSKKYTSAFNRWCRFITITNKEKQSVPANSVHVSFYLTHLINIGCSFNIVPSSVYAIKWAHSSLGYSDPTDHSLKIHKNATTNQQ